MTFRSRIIVLLIGVALLVPTANAAQKSSSKSKSDTAASTRVPADEGGVNAVLNALSSAASNQDAEKMAALWSVDGFYVDSDGVETKGRLAVKERFAGALAGKPKATVALSASAIKFLAPDAAWVEGTATRQATSGMEPSTRFTMLLQKSGSGWAISSATETPITSKNVSDQLAKLSWLLGEWTAKQGDGKLTMTADWTGNKSFILMKFVVSKPGEADKHDTQVIGWDPSKEQVVSWHFDDNGGFGYGSWSKRGKQWVISTEGVEQTGGRTSALNILSVADQDHFTWQSVNRAVDGLSVPDTGTLTVQRTQKVSSRTDESKI